MKTNYNFDLKKRCYKLSLDIISLIELLPNKRISCIIGDQLLRSGMSIGANLYEASASSTRIEFKKFYEISLKSANETLYWLGLIKDSKLINHEKIDYLIQEVKEIANMLASGVIKLKSKRTF
ncbi:MAG: four helix bundle protein [Patescibacteria group bacterium]|nr:MAG: four helix bundle protein [Patescibacteria group bacterium]